MRKAFTLAEVLITLSIIGIVAAMTLPNLIQKNNNKVVEARLTKFYSSINQAVQMAEVKYGDKKIWFEDVTGAQLDENGKPIEGSSNSEKWFNKYLKPYLKIVKQETRSDGSFIVYFPDGSALSPQKHTTRDWLFYPGNVTKCRKTSDWNNYGVCVFNFQFCPRCSSSGWTHLYNKGFEPFKYGWNGDISKLERSCNERASMGDDSVDGRAYCAALIQMNGWKIPDNYAYKVRY